MCRPHSVVAGVFLACVGFLPGGALAANRLSLPQVTVPAGATGLSLLVSCEHEDVLSGFTLVLRYDPGEVQVTGVTTAGTSADGADLFAGSFDSGVIAFGCILDSTPPFTKYLEPSGGHTLARITLDVLAASGTDVVLTFENGYDDGVKILDNELVTREGDQVLPTLANGKITVTDAGADVPPIADAGADVTVTEGARVTLDASGSQAQKGGALTFEWAQVFPGPGIVDPGPTDGVQFSFTAPPVAGDTDTLFKVTVTEGALSDSDEVTVRVVDIDSRAVDVSSDPAAGALIDGGTRALLFKGDILWTSPDEASEWTYIRFTGVGKGNDAKLLSGLGLYFDDGDGTFGPEDEQIGETLPPEKDAPVEFAVNRQLSSGTARTFFLVGTVAKPKPPAEAWVLLPAAALLALAVAGAGLRRRPSLLLLLILVLAALPATLTACFNGGGGSSSREVRFDVLAPEDVGVQGFVTGVSIPPQGVPLAGPTVEV